MEEKLCWSCQGTGTGSWCSYCKPKKDVFGVPLVEGRLGTWMQTYMGLQSWPRSPRVEDIAIEDIAIGLARECRYGKQTLRWYSVAEHSVIVSLLVEDLARSQWPDNPDLADALAKEGLFHDCDEAPLHDMPRPIKHDPEMGLASYRACGTAYRAVVFERFRIRPTRQTHELIDTIDKRLVVDEVNQFMRTPSMYLERHVNVKATGVKIEGLEWAPAMELFLSRFATLYPEELAP